MVFDDPNALSDAQLLTLKSIVIRQGLPAEWCETPEFRANLVRLFTALGSSARDLMLLTGSMLTKPWLKPRLWSMARNMPLLGGAFMLAKGVLVAALDQPVASLTPPEAYVPMAGFTPAYEVEAVDLTEQRYADRFFYDHDEATIDRVLGQLSPEVVAIGSGPACAAALASIYDKRPHTVALVLDLGDYFRQQDYDATTPAAVGMQAYRHAGGGSLIVNGFGRVSANFAPQVWGGGAEIFSGTAHALPEWYRRRLPMSEADAKRHEARVRSDCRISRTPWDILNDAQKRFFTAADTLGHKPYLLEGFGRGGDRGQGRCYAGKKGRIPYLDQAFAGSKPLTGFANCRVDTILRAPNGRVAALELSFLSRHTRQPLFQRTLELPERCAVLLGAGSLGDQRVLRASGDAVAAQRRPGVRHQYTCEVAALFDEPLSANGIPQGIGAVILPDEERPDGDIERRVCVEGAHPGRALLASLALSGASDPLKAWQATPRVGTVGIMFTESRPGVQMVLGNGELTLQRLTKHDFARALRGIKATVRVWAEAKARGVALNLPARFVSKQPELAATGFAAIDEIDALLDHAVAHPPILQVFYRTGHRFGTVRPDNGEVPGFNGLYLVGEDAIPPGPGVNPTLAILLLAHHYGEAIAQELG